MTQTETQAHTPGPWKAYRSAVQDANGRVIITQSWTNRLTDDQYTEPVKAVLSANARLIAAAPDLLNLIEEFAFEMDRTVSDLGTDDCVEGDWLKKARAAIAKAKGWCPS